MKILEQRDPGLYLADILAQPFTPKTWKTQGLTAQGTVNRNYARVNRVPLSDIFPNVPI